MSKIGTRLCGALLLGTLALGCAADGPSESELGRADEALATSALELPVTLRKTGKTRVSATVFKNPRRGTARLNVLALHGLAETAATYGPLAEAVFHDPELGRRVQVNVRRRFALCHNLRRIDMRRKDFKQRLKQSH